MKTGKALILLISPVGTPAMQTAEMASRLKEADPTMVLGPSASDSKLFPMIPITARRISGAEDPGDRGIWNICQFHDLLHIYQRKICSVNI